MKLLLLLLLLVTTIDDEASGYFKDLQKPLSIRILVNHIYIFYLYDEIHTQNGEVQKER